MEGGLFHISLLLGVLHSLCLHGQYILIQTNKTWNDAEAYCIENHLSLALIPNQSDLDIFREIMSDTNFSQAWMGLSVDVNSWRWSYQNENLTFTKWSSGEPNNAGGSEECGSMFKYGNDVLWNDANCYAHLNCVCFHEPTKEFIYVSDQSRTWPEAQQYCRQHYTDLAIIHNTDDQNKILNLISEQCCTWMGLFRDSWKWLDGTAVSSTSVGQVNANNKEWNEACGWADPQGRTEDATCSLLLPFVCSQKNRRQIVRIEVKSNRSIETDAHIQAIILQWIQEKLLHHGMAVTSRATWKVQTDGLLFHKTDTTPKTDPYTPTTHLDETCQQKVNR